MADCFPSIKILLLNFVHLSRCFTGDFLPANRHFPFVGIAYHVSKSSDRKKWKKKDASREKNC